MIRKRLFLSVLVLTLCLFTASAYAADAMSLLTGMAQKIASAKKFSVTIRMRYDVVQDSGQKVEFGEIRKIILKRPKYLRVEAKQSDGDVNGMNVSCGLHGVSVKSHFHNNLILTKPEESHIVSIF